MLSKIKYLIPLLIVPIFYFFSDPDVDAEPDLSSAEPSSLDAQALTLSEPYQAKTYEIYECKDFDQFNYSVTWNPDYNLDHKLARLVIMNDIDCKGATKQQIGGPVSDSWHRFSGIMSCGKGDGTPCVIKNLTIKDPSWPSGNSVGVPVGFFSEVGPTTISVRVSPIEYIDVTYYPIIKDIIFDSITILAYTDADRGLIAGKAHNLDIYNVQGRSINMPYDTAVYPSEYPFYPFGQGGFFGITTNVSLCNVRFDTLKMGFDGYNAGGLIGVANGNLDVKYARINNLENDKKNCKNKNAREEDCSFGGLIGKLSGGNATIIESSVSNVKSASNLNAGGLIGVIKPDMTVRIENSYANISVEGSQYGGGIIGHLYESGSTPTVCFESVMALKKTAIPEDQKGRTMVGTNLDKTSRVTRCGNTDSFYNKSVYDHNKKSGDSISIAKTDGQLKDPYTFTGWDKYHWTILSGQFPTLKSEDFNYAKATCEDEYQKKHAQ